MSPPFIAFFNNNSSFVILGSEGATVSAGG